MAYNNKARPSITKVPGEKPMITYMKDLVFNKNKCINCVATGEVGSGKSWAMLSIACMLNPDFELKGNWFFHANDLWEEIKNVDNWEKGRMLFYDEAGIDLNSNSWQNTINKAYNAFFQTARHRNYMFFCTVPYLRFISSGVRKMFNLHLESQGWNSRNQTIITPRIIQYNGELDKYYKKRILIRDPVKGGSYLGQTMHLPKPPARIIREYEELKSKFTSNLYSNIGAEIDAHMAKEKKKITPKAVTMKEFRLIESMQAGLSKNDILDKHKIASSTWTDHLTSLKAKGFEIQHNMKKNGYDVIEPKGMKVDT